MEQPNEATAKAEVDGPTVSDDTIMALKGQEPDKCEKLTKLKNKGEKQVEDM